MNIEIAQPSRAGRWPTVNTKIAACLLAYGYRLCPEQPFIRTAGAKTPDKISTTIWFEESHPAGVTDATPQDWEVAWRNWRDLETCVNRYAIAPDWRVPFIRMRHGVDCRQWFAENVIRQKISEPDPAHPYRTDNMLFAICALSLGHHLYSNDSGRFTFDGTKVGLPLYQQFIEDGAQRPIQWAKVAIVQQENLVALIQNDKRYPDNVANIQFKVGSKIAWVPVNMPPSTREQLVRLLYAS